MSNGIGKNPLLDISKVYLESVAESAVPGKPAEKLKTDRAGYSIPKADQMSAAERIKKKTAEKKAALEKKHGMKMDDHPEFPKKKYVDEKLDPVGQEDADIDNDGDTDKSDKYLHKRRKAISKAMGKRLKEERASLSEVMTDTEDEKPIKEKKINNKIKINPKLGEAVEELGGEILEAKIDPNPNYSETHDDQSTEDERKSRFGPPSKSHQKVDPKTGKHHTHHMTGQKAIDAYDAKRKKEKEARSIKGRLKSAAKKLLRREEVEVDEAYTVTNADKKGNTQAYKNYKAGMKGKDGKPLYKAADHMKESSFRKIQEKLNLKKTQWGT